MSTSQGRNGHEDQSGDYAEQSSGLGRRQVLKILGGMGIGSVAFQRALAAQAQDAPRVTPEMIKEAEWIAGLELTEEERESTARGVNGALRSYDQMRAVELDNGVSPAMSFDCAPWLPPSRETTRGPVTTIESATPQLPTSDEDLAFMPVSELSALMRTRAVSSVRLTKLYLTRLKKYDPALRCVVNLTEELALKQAEQADKEIASGRYRGPLHGIPWGAKDLVAVPGYPTTWGATPYKDRVIDQKATVAKRLEEAGAVLIAKLSMGALAQGDRWFGGRTRNPWNPKRGSSGSSAGSASSTSAGLVGFTLGTETLGSIVSPCSTCGVTGLRPTFGRVSRHGCMALSWSMDKIGSIARSVEDCALVFGAIHGWDGLDPTAVDRPFTWPLKRDVRTLTVGYFEPSAAPQGRGGRGGRGGGRGGRGGRRGGRGGQQDNRAHEESLEVLRGLGFKLVPIELPSQYPANALRMILNTEAATAFDQITRDKITEGLNSWPNSFRQGQFVPAVEYLRANRIRSLVMKEMKEKIAGVDAYVDVRRRDLTLTNLTGHPSVVMPNGLREGRDGGPETPTSILFTGKLFGETELLAIAHAYQQATGHHLKRPPMDKVTVENADG